MLDPAQSARLCVVLVATRNPLNMGAAARAMSNFGFTDLRAVRPYETAFREARSAVGAELLLQNAREFASVAEAVHDCGLVVGTSAASRHRDAQHPVYRLEAARTHIEQALPQTNVALLFGSEKFGLSNDDLSHCDWLLHIPARAEHASMNLGQSVALCLYELIRNEQAAGPITQGSLSMPASSKMIEALKTAAHEMLAASGYLQRHPRANMDAELRRLIRRMRLDAKDTEAVLGMLRQTLWKLRLPPG